MKLFHNQQLAGFENKYLTNELLKMKKILLTAVYLIVLSLVLQAVTARPFGEAKPPPSKKDILNGLNKIQQEFGYFSVDAKNLIDIDIDPLLDYIDEFILLLKEFFQGRARRINYKK